MTKAKIISIMLLAPLVVVVLLSGFNFNPRNNFLELLEAALEQYNRDFYMEKAYLVTDRFAYRPGEDLWFKGFVSAAYPKPGDSVSQDLYIKLLNSKGEEIIFRRYPLAMNQITGRFLIPRTSIPGKYTLIAYTSWMKNQGIHDAFRKEILVSRYYDKRFQVDISYDRIAYYPDDTLQASIKIMDPAGKPIVETEFGYSVETLERTYHKGNVITDNKGKALISCSIPQSDDILMLKVEAESRKLSGSYIVVIPFAVMPKLAFFPEAGNLVAGLINTIAFRANGPYGLPAPIEGQIVDRHGVPVESVKTSSNGLGSFMFTPTTDTFYFKIIKPAGIDRLFPLPVADNKGVVVHLKDVGSTMLNLEATVSDSTLSGYTYWVAIMNHEIVWSDSIHLTNRESVSIPLTGLPTGIMQVNVFNQNREMIAERLAYVQGDVVQLKTKTDRQIYQRRQRVVLSLDYSGSSNQIDLAVSVALRQLASQTPVNDFNRVLNSFPGDSVVLFNQTDQPSDLDLLTTQHRLIQWNELLSVQHIKPYYRHDGLSGLVVDRKENPSKHAKVRVTHIPNYRFYETQANENGNFSIPFGSDIIDFNYLNVDAYDALGKLNLTARVDQDYSAKLRENIVEVESSNYNKIRNVISYNDPDLVYSLRYGARKLKKSDTEPGKKYDPNYYSHYATVMDIIEELKPYTLKNNIIVFSETEQANASPGFLQEGVIIVINGALKGTNAEVLKNLLPSDITNINISTSLIDVHRYTPINFQGVMELTTIQGMYRYRQPAVQLGMDVLNTSREFHFPNYTLESPTSADNRKTLYWNPSLTIRNGQPALITFYTSDVKGVYTGIIEGMNAAGKPLKASFSIIVE